MNAHSLDALREQAARSIRLAMHEKRPTEYLRTAAERFVDARSLILTADGEPDWRGQTWTYKRWVGEALGAAGVPASERTTLLSAIRHHVSNVLHERLDDETLEELGLRPLDARERSVEKRARQTAAMEAFRGGAQISDPDTIAEAMRRAETMLRRLDLEVLAALPPEERAAVAERVESLRKRAADVAEGVAGAPKGRRRGPGVTK